MSIETRLNKLERIVRADKPDKEALHIFMELDETQAEAIARYELENGIKYSEDKHDLVIISWISDKKDLDK